MTMNTFICLESIGKLANLSMLICLTKMIITTDDKDQHVSTVIARLLACGSKHYEAELCPYRAACMD